ncbi:retinitis pigmentosa 1-like 1 protein [Phoenix dactylifera]|uniref:Retinitis pigmentosa 1-like 1 protein n=1 Tax=Phoenix dactylifera TaxID=42345 RepID=A0A8B7BR74_PHODC|nr:retinitis pigmentosa 1-like 1 protein [Phoenix dactylifera]
MSASPSVDEAAALYSSNGGGQEGGSTSMPASDPGGGEETGGESMVETLEENRRGLVDSGGADSAEKPELNVGEERDAAGADEVSGAVVPEGAEGGESRNGTGVELLKENVAAFKEKGQGVVPNEVKEHDLVDECFQDTEVGNLGSRGQEMGDGCNGDQELIADALETGNIGRIALKEAKAEGLESVADLGGNVEDVVEIRKGTEPMKEKESCPEKRASAMNDVTSGDWVDRKAEVIESNVCPSELVPGDELGGDQKLKLDVKEAESVMGVAEAAATGTGGAVEVDGLEGEPASEGKVDVVETGNKTEFLKEDEPYIEKEQSKANDVKGHDLVDKQLKAKEGILGPNGLEMEDGFGSKQKLEINVVDGENVECEKGTELMKKQITNQNLDCKVRGQDLVDEHLQAPEGDVGSMALETENKLGGDEKLEASVGDAGSGVGTVKTQAAVAFARVEADRSEGVAGPGQIQVGVAEFSNGTELPEGVLSCPEEDKSLVGEVTDLQAAEGTLVPKLLETDNILDGDQNPEPGVLEVGCLSEPSNYLGGEEAERLESTPELGQAQHKVPETSNGTDLTGQAVSCPQKNQNMVTEKGGHDLADAHGQASEGDGSQNQSVFAESTGGNKDMEEGLFLGSNQDTQICSAGRGIEAVEGSLVSGDQDRDHEASVSQTSVVNTDQNNQEVSNAIHREETKEVDSLPVDDAIIEQGDHVVKDSDLADSGVEVNNPDSHVIDDLVGSGPIVTAQSEAGLAESVVDAAVRADKYPSDENARDKLDITTADGNSVLVGTIMELESKGRQPVDENTSGKGDNTMANSCPDLESKFVGTCPLASVLNDSKSSVTPGLLMASELSVSGKNQEREPQFNGLLVERSDDSIVHEAESSPGICQNMDMESRVLKDETSLPEACHEKKILLKLQNLIRRALCWWIVWQILLLVQVVLLSRMCRLMNKDIQK